MPQRNFLAFDLGAESGRAVLGTLDGQTLSLAEQHRFPNPTGRMSGHLFWNLLGQWEELKIGLRQTFRAKPSISLDGIGVDTWGVDFGLVMPNGQIRGLPFHYRDSRTDRIMEKTFQTVSQAEIFEATGLQFMQFNTLFQLVAMKESGGLAPDSTDTLLFMPDLFNYLFTGQRKSESSIASTSQMYDPRAKAWATNLLDKLQLPTGILAPVIPSGTIVGPLRDDVAAECDVLAQVQVIAPACHDTASAVASVPAEGDDWCYISSGTWSLMGVELKQPIINDKSLKYNYTNEGGVGGTIRFLRNIMGLWLVQECRRQFRLEGYEHSYAELTSMAERAEAHRSLIDPSYGPFLAPGQMCTKIEEFCRKTKQRVPVNRGEFIRTCLDSLALTYRKTLDGLEDMLGRTIKVIHIVGGGTQNELLSQMTADACHRTVVAGPVEATAAGNVLVQAMATGNIKSLAEARAIVRNSFPLKRYEPSDSAKWDRAYARYREITSR